MYRECHGKNSEAAENDTVDVKCDDEKDDL